MGCLCLRDLPCLTISGFLRDFFWVELLTKLRPLRGNLHITHIVRAGAEQPFMVAHNIERYVELPTTIDEQTCMFFCDGAGGGKLILT